MDPLLQRLAEEQTRRYYGKYRGFVVDNQDPERRGRLKVVVPSVLGQQDSGWALPCLPFGGLTNQGLFMIPEIEAQVWVEFEEGNVDHPIWVGVFWQQESDIPEEAALDEPTTRIIRTPSGHVLQFDDASGEEQFRLAHPAGTEMTIDPQGTVKTEDAAGNTLTLDAESNEIVLEDANGNRLKMDRSGTEIKDANGNKVVMSASGIEVEGTKVVIKGAMVDIGGPGGEPLIKAQTFLSMFNSHMHVCTMPGSPTGPPIPPLTPVVLTTKTKAL
ncbi:phage baseplate assembly protein V [Aliiglaciecola sp. CAU 1673]|uniref:phage baseplate assembly protein V n=1 Tax=Aliiglaciecola sp. CAU 1673 TaxID=3032595 RepID=UPI0023DA1F7B|nr:phage baseplate assembly protein V [Aliiglaciecola sp. CAU 1673]MDF2177355.1 phage baseplate assembly protein V [Aliiglaciecola sp. CAU 1673]